MYGNQKIGSVTAENYGGSEVMNDKSPSEVTTELASLQDGIIYLRKMLETLEHNLSPILQASNPEKVGTEIKQSALVPLAEELRQKRFLVNNCVAHVENILARIQL